MTKPRTTDEFIEQAKYIHGDKFDYSLVHYINGINKIILKCNKCGNIWPQKPDNHLQGIGCPKCANLSRRLSKDDFIKRAIKINKDKFDYSFGEYLGYDKKYKIYCNKGEHFFDQTPHNHLNDHKCLICENNSRCKSFDQFVIDARTIHGNNYEYFPENYKNSITKFDIKCNRCELIYPSTPHNHLAGRGCPACGREVFISKAEIKWLKSLNILNLDKQYTIYCNDKKFLVDGFDPLTNTVYEFYGDYWHGNPNKFKPDALNKRNGTTFGQLYQRTIERENLLKSAGYTVIFIWENDWKQQQKSSKKNFK